MSGEILRAMLTNGNAKRRYRVYQANVTIPANSSPNTGFDLIFKFDQGRYFLWTGTAYHASGSSVPQPEDLNWLVSFRKNNNKKSYQLEPQLAASVGYNSFVGASDNQTGEYALFTSNDNLGVIVAQTATQANDTTYYIGLSGIEYIPAS